MDQPFQRLAQINRQTKFGKNVVSVYVPYLDPNALRQKAVILIQTNTIILFISMYRLVLLKS